MEKCFLTRNNDQWATPSNIYNLIMLLPSRTGTKWFKKIIQNQMETNIYFFTQRLHFNDSKSAPFDCMLVVMKKTRMPIHTIQFINRNMEIEE